MQICKQENEKLSFIYFSLIKFNKCVIIWKQDKNNKKKLLQQKIIKIFNNFLIKNNKKKKFNVGFKLNKFLRWILIQFLHFYIPMSLSQKFSLQFIIESDIFNCLGQL